MYRSFLTVSMLIVAALIALPTFAQDKPYIVIDAETGEVLAENEPHHRWYPASLTKLMTAYVTFRAIKAGEVTAGSPVFISDAAARRPPSKMGYKRGVQLRIDTALKIIIIKSANDVSHALAEAVSGSVESFVERMNSEARRLGMINTQFANASGLYNRSQFSSARDMALLSQQILNEFPEHSYLFSAVGIQTPVRIHYSYNLLIERFSGTTGMKTGFVCAAGYNMVASAKRSGRHLIAVVLGRDSQTDRAVAAARLITESAGSSGIYSVHSSASRGTDPVNMRPILCTQQARESRYDPVSGTAVIDSPFLKPKGSDGAILPVNTGGVDSSPSEAWINRNLKFNGTPPVPIRRPNYDPALGRIVLAAIGEPANGTIPIPTPRPQ